MLRSTMPRTLRSRRHKALIAALVQARRDAGFTQRALSVRLKVTQTWIASIEAGQRRVDVVEFLDLCKAIKVKPLALLREVDSSLL